MSTEISSVIAPLIQRRIFETEEEAVRELLRGYVLAQVDRLRKTLNQFEQQYGMSYERFGKYLRERSALLVSEALTPEQRATLGQAVMREEDDWLDWKVSTEMLDRWLGLQAEVKV
jgi:phytoene dehydrogenase-like protein